MRSSLPLIIAVVSFMIGPFADTLYEYSYLTNIKVAASQSMLQGQQDGEPAHDHSTDTLHNHDSAYRPAFWNVVAKIKTQIISFRRELRRTNRRLVRQPQDDGLDGERDLEPDTQNRTKPTAQLQSRQQYNHTKPPRTSQPLCQGASMSKEYILIAIHEFNDPRIKTAVDLAGYLINELNNHKFIEGKCTPFAWDILLGILKAATPKAEERALDRVSAMNWRSDQQDAIFFAHNPQEYRTVPEKRQAIQNGISFYKAKGNCLCVISPTIDLPAEVEKFIFALDLEQLSLPEVPGFFERSSGHFSLTGFRCALEMRG